ncbi:MAG: hypothetical protein IT379_05200 [Deltaproteobacteria bacterium]|nr:hypothetical protein [Deltaproteobacteria bacterium]
MGQIVRGAWLLAYAVVVACDGDPASECVAGQTQPCSCAPRGAGVRFCQSGAWDPCSCPPGPWDDASGPPSPDASGPPPPECDGQENAPTADRIMAAGDSFTCVARYGDVLCWGANDSGQLGQGDPAWAGIEGGPEWIPRLHGVVSIDAHGQAVCATTEDGGVVCWGEPLRVEDDLSECEGDARCGYTPRPVQGLGPVRSVALGNEFRCAVDSIGLASCWGSNGAGQLGDGTTIDRSWPAAVSALGPLAHLAASDASACGADVRGDVFCWGLAVDGNIGILGGAECRCAWAPAAQPTLCDIVEVDQGQYHTCARSKTGQVHCWGNGMYGQLGVLGLPVSCARGGPPFPCTRAPQRVADLDDAVQIALGAFHTCVLRSTGTVSCWGLAEDGVLAQTLATPSTCHDFNGRDVQCFLVPTPVMGLSDVVAIAAGRRHTCAMRSTGTVACWGDNERRQLGGIDRGPRLAEVPLPE